MTDLMVKDAERGVIGAIIIDAVTALHHCHQWGVSPQWFADSGTRAAWEAIAEMGTDPSKIELYSLSARHPHLEKLFEECVDACVTATYLPTWLELLHTYRLRRGLRRVGLELQGKAEDVEENPHEVASKVATAVQALTQTREVRRTPAEVYDDIIGRWSRAGEDNTYGISSRWKSLNTLLGGYRAGKVYVVGARPRDGKSTFMSNEALSMAKRGIAVSVASLEMDEAELRGRMLAEDADLSSFSLDVGHGTDDRIATAKFFAESHVRLPVRIDDGGKTIDQLISWMTGEALIHHAQILFIDYLQIISSSKRVESRNVEVSIWSNAIRDAAKRLGVPVVLLSQLSRDSAKAEKKPTLHDLRDSGSVEQDAYGVILLHHSRDDLGKIASSEFLLEKHRGGPTGHLRMSFVGNRQRFEEWSKPEEGRKPHAD